MATPERRHPDLKLAESVLSGSLHAWHEFVTRYAGLICSVLRRHLLEEDDVRAEFVEVLAVLRESKLEQYQGESALSTWLVVVARRHAIDVVRRRCGRWDLPRVIRELPEAQQLIFRLHFLEGRPFGEIRALLAHDGHPLSLDEVVAAIQHQLEILAPAVVSRLDYSLRAQRMGLGTSRLLPYLDAVLHEEGELQNSDNPELKALRAESERILDLVRRRVESLPPQEREILELRFAQGLSAPKIADQAGLDGPRRVYSILNRVLAELRKRFGSDPALRDAVDEWETPRGSETGSESPPERNSGRNQSRFRPILKSTDRSPDEDRGDNESGLG